MALRQNKGLNALAEVASISEAPNVFHAGFVFGPRINAGGRVGESGLGACCFRLMMKWKQGQSLSSLINTIMRDVIGKGSEEAIEIAETEQKDNKILVISGNDWHPGVIGIVASRLKGKIQQASLRNFI